MRVLIVGATSAIAEAACRFMATRGDALYLVGRNGERLRTMAEDLSIRGASLIHEEVMDATDYDRHQGLTDRARQVLGGLDTVLIAYGTLPEHTECTLDFDAAYRAIEVNCLTVLSLLTHIANDFEHRRAGTIAVVSSIAGDRGRKSNYIYGTAKAAVSTFLSGLRQRLHASGVAVVTIKPGFVDTPMTAHMTKGALWASPERVAKGILHAIDEQKSVVYLPWFWQPIMFIIRHIPEFVFKRTNL